MHTSSYMAINLSNYSHLEKILTEFFKSSDLITKYWLKSQETEIIFITLLQIYWNNLNQSCAQSDLASCLILGNILGIRK